MINLRTPVPCTICLGSFVFLQYPPDQPDLPTDQLIYTPNIYSARTTYGLNTELLFSYTSC